MAYSQDDIILEPEKTSQLSMQYKWCTRKYLRPKRMPNQKMIMIICSITYSIQAVFIFLMVGPSHSNQQATQVLNFSSLVLMFISLKKSNDLDFKLEASNAQELKNPRWMKSAQLLIVTVMYILVSIDFVGNQDMISKFKLVDGLFTISFILNSYTIAETGADNKFLFLIVTLTFIYKISIEIYFTTMAIGLQNFWNFIAFCPIAGLLIIFSLYLVGKRLLTEQQLFMKAERIMKDIIFHIPSGVILFDQNQKPMFVNNKLLEIIGLPLGSDLELVLPVLNTLSFDSYRKRLATNTNSSKFSWNSTLSYKRSPDLFSFDKPLKFKDIMNIVQSGNCQSSYYTAIEKLGGPDKRNKKIKLKTFSRKSESDDEGNSKEGRRLSKIEEVLKRERYYKVEIILFKGEASFKLLTFDDITTAKSITESNMEKCLKNSLLNSFSHELKTPLNNSLSVLNCAINDATVSRSMKDKYLKYPLNSMCLLNLMIHDIIDYLKLETGQLHLSSDIFSLKGLLKEVKSLISIKTEEKGLKLLINESQVPNSLILRGDRERVLRLVVNFILNCLKYTFTGHIRVVCSNRVISGENYECLEISDTRFMKSKKWASDDYIIESDSQKKILSESEEFNLMINWMMMDYILQNNRCFESSASEMGITFKIYIPCTKPVHKVSSEGSDLAEIVLDSNQPKEYQTSFKSFQSQEKSSDLNEGIAASPNIINCKANIISCSKEKAVQRGFEPTSSLKFLQVDSSLARVADEFTYSKENNEDDCPRNKNGLDDITKTVSQKNITLISSSPTFSAQRENSRICLIVDDDPFNLLSLEMILKAEGIKCVKALNGLLAVELVAHLTQINSTVDFALLDLNMPIMDGYDCAKNLIQKMESNMIKSFPIVACSANDSFEDRERAFSSGMVSFISKPITVRKLREVIEPLGCLRRMGSLRRMSKNKLW